MKHIVFLLLVFISGCSSRTEESKLVPYVNENVCSDKSLAYLAQVRYATPNAPKYTTEDFQKLTGSMGPLVQECYQRAMDESTNGYSLNLCLVMGYDAKGKIDFFEFSTKDMELPASFKVCLDNIKNSSELQGYRELIVNQPYRLYPKILF